MAIDYKRIEELKELGFKDNQIKILAKVIYEAVNSNESMESAFRIIDEFERALKLASNNDLMTMKYFEIAKKIYKTTWE